MCIALEIADHVCIPWVRFELFENEEPDLGNGTGLTQEVTSAKILYSSLSHVIMGRPFLDEF